MSTNWNFYFSAPEYPPEGFMPENPSKGGILMCFLHCSKYSWKSKWKPTQVVQHILPFSSRLGRCSGETLQLEDEILPTDCLNTWSSVGGTVLEVVELWTWGLLSRYRDIEVTEGCRLVLLLVYPWFLLPAMDHTLPKINPFFRLLYDSDGERN